MVRSLLVIVTEDQALIQKAQSFAQMHGLPVNTMSPEAYERLRQGPAASSESLLPGTGSVAGSEGGKVLPFPGAPSWASGGADPRKGVATINQLESVAIENAIAAFKGNLTEAAKALGIGRATLYRKVKQYSIDSSAVRKKRAA